jgi:very-short-patch-repair endonuclease
MPLNLQQPPTEMTPQEVKIANYLSELGLRWESQRQVGKYFVDFWIAEIGTVIEADGVYGHFAKKDAERDSFLLDSGIDQVLHIKSENSSEIHYDIDMFLIDLSAERK